MKKYFLIIFLFSSIYSYCQKMNGFKYVYVAPITYTSGSKDYWGIEEQTKKFFRKLGYTIINNQIERINVAADIANICEILDISITHTNCKINCYNTVSFSLFDCNGLFNSFNGKSMSLSLKGDYRNATKKALNRFSSKYIKEYSFDSNYTSKFKTNVTQNKDLNFLDEKSLREYLSNRKLHPLEGIWEYENNDASEYKLLLLKEEHLFSLYIIEGNGLWNPSDKKAEFETTASDEVITMKWTMGDKKTVKKSVGQIKNNAIIEFNNKMNTGSTVLYKVYPKFDSVSKKRIVQNGEWASNGSGVIISKSGHIITNYHVIEDANEIEVEFIMDNKTQMFNAEIVQVDKVNDLAVLKIFDMNFDGVNEPPYYFKLRGSDVGTKVYAFGYPFALNAMGKEIKVTDGMISSKTGFDGNITTYQITAPIQAGNSGGPLFDEEANLIGINSSGVRKDIVDNVAYSIKTSYVSNLLDILPKSINLPSSTKLKSLSLVEQIREISKYVVLIKVR